MKNSKTTLMELTRQYKNVLKKCFLLNLGVILISLPVLAGEISTDTILSSPYDEDLIVKSGATATMNGDLGTGFNGDMQKLTVESGGKLVAKALNPVYNKTGELDNPISNAINVWVKNLTVENGATLEMSGVGSHSVDFSDIKNATLSGDIHITNGRIETHTEDEDNALDTITLNGANVVMDGDYSNMESGGVLTVKDSIVKIHTDDHGLLSASQLNVDNSTVDLSKVGYLIAVKEPSYETETATGALIIDNDSTVNMADNAYLYGDSIALKDSTVSVAGNNHFLTTEAGKVSLDKATLNIAEGGRLTVLESEASIATIDDEVDENYSYIVDEYKGELPNHAGTLTITDGTKLNVSGTLNANVDVNGGSVNIDSGVLKYAEGGMHISGGTITLDNEGEIWGPSKDAKVTISGGKVILKNNSDITPDGTLEISGGIIETTASEIAGKEALKMTGGTLTLSNGVFGAEGPDQKGDDSYHKDGKVVISGGTINVNPLEGKESVLSENWDYKSNVLMGKDITMTGGEMNIAQNAILEFRDGFKTDEETDVDVLGDVSTLALTGGSLNLAGTFDGNILAGETAGTLNINDSLAAINGSVSGIDVNINADYSLKDNNFSANNLVIGDGEDANAILTIDGDIGTGADISATNVTLKSGSGLIVKTTTAQYAKNNNDEMENPILNGVNFRIGNLITEEGSTLTVSGHSLNGNGHHSADVSIDTASLSGNINLKNGTIEGDDEDPSSEISLDTATITMEGSSNIEVGGSIGIKDSAVTANTDDHGFVSGTDLTVDHSTVALDGQTHLVAYKGFEDVTGQLSVQNGSSITLKGMNLLAGDTVSFDESNLIVQGNGFITSKEADISFTNKNKKDTMGQLQIDKSATLTVLSGYGMTDIDDDEANEETVLEAYQSLNPETGTLNFWKNTVLNNNGSLAANLINAGTVLNNGSIIGDVINNGEFTGQVASVSGTFENEGILNTSGELSKAVTGQGTTVLTGDLVMKPTGSVTGLLDMNGQGISLTDEEISSYQIGSLKGEGKVSLDLLFDDTVTADAITITSGTKNAGTLKIKHLNILGGEMTDTFNVAVLKGTTSGLSLELALSDEEAALYTKQGEWEDKSVIDHLSSAETLWGTQFNKTDWKTRSEWLLSTDGTNLKREKSVTETEKTKTGLGDTLALLNTAALEGADDFAERAFKTADAKATYVVNDHLGQTVGTMKVIGSIDGKDMSTLDMNGKNGFVLTDGSQVYLENLNIVNAADRTGGLLEIGAQDAVATLKNIRISEAGQNSVMNTGVLHLGGQNVFGTGIVGSVGKENTKGLLSVDDGQTTITDINQAKVNISQGAELTVNDSLVSGTRENEGIINKGKLTVAWDNLKGNLDNSNGILETWGTINRDVTGTLNLVKDSAISQDVRFGSVNVRSSLDLDANTLTADTVQIAENSTVSFLLKNKNMYGQIKANKINISEEGTTLKITLNSNMLNNKKPVQMQVLDTNDLTGSFANLESNARYDFKDLGNGLFEISKIATATDVIADVGGDNNAKETAAAWLDSSSFAEESTAAVVAEHLNVLSQDNPVAFKEAVKALQPDAAPTGQATAAAVNNQVAGAVSGRFGGPAPQGRSGGDIFKNTGMWAQGLYNKSKLDTDTGFDGKAKGLAMGADGEVAKGLKIGLGYAYTTTDINATGRTTDVDTHTGILYAEKAFGNAFVNGVLTYGRSGYKENKNVAGMTVKADYDMDSVFTQFMTGYGFYFNNLMLTPETGLRYLWTKTHAYTDTASQSVSENTTDTLTGVIGVRSSMAFQLDKMTLVPELKIAATYDIKNDKAGSIVHLANGSSYSVDGKSLNRFGVETGAKVGLTLDNMEFSLNYEGKFKKDYSDHTGMLNFRYNF